MEVSREHKERISRDVRTIHFMDAEKFSDLFEEWRWWENDGAVLAKSGAMYPEIPVPNSDHATISSYCSTHRTGLSDSLHVKPKQEVIDFLFRSMIFPDYDSVYFELVLQSGGTLLVSAKNNVIIGSRWLAMMPGSAIEEIKREAL